VGSKLDAKDRSQSALRNDWGLIYRRHVKPLIWLRAMINELDKCRGTLPREFLLGWIAWESDGNLKSTTPLHELGYFQIMWQGGEAKDQVHISLEEFPRLAMDPEYSIEKGVALAEAYRKYILENYTSVSDGTDLLWRLTKARHAASGVLRVGLRKLQAASAPMTWASVKNVLPSWMLENVENTMSYATKLKLFVDLVPLSVRPISERNEAADAAEAVNRNPEYIRWVQSSLNQVDGAGLVADGISGPKTRAAVRKFQQRHGLKVDGVVGPQTEGALIAAGAPGPPGYPPPPTPVPPDIVPSNVFSTERIDLDAQLSLQRMISGGPDARLDALSILAAVLTTGELAGIYGDNLKKAAELAARHGTQQFRLVPEGQDGALVLEPGDVDGSRQPTIIFRGGNPPATFAVRRAPDRLDAAIRSAWSTYRLVRSGTLSRCELPGPPITFSASADTLVEAVAACTPVPNLFPAVLGSLKPVGSPCPPFLPPVTNPDYLRYIRPPTTGRILPLINGRSSGGKGPDVDRTEPLDAMETMIKSLRSGDFVYLSAWFFEPATALTAGGAAGATNWGTLFAKKAAEGVIIRIIINDFDPITGLDKWLETTSLRPLNAIIAAIPAAQRDNLKYIVSMQPAQIGALKSLLAGQGGRAISIGSHHQKFMVVKKGDEITAYCGGLDIESRKTPARWSYKGLIGWHDIHLSIEGPATRDLEFEFVSRWNREKGSSTRPPLAGWKPMETLPLTPLSQADRTAAKQVHQVQMLRTVSVDAITSPYSTERDDVRRVYERGIQCASEWLYMENQYFRSLDLADWVVKQGTARPNLIVIIVVVASAAADDGTNPVTEHGDFLQFETFRRIVTALGNRARLYTMKNRAVHSKFIMVDDRWMSIGSANANARSFELDTELNLSIGEPDLVASFRRRLWAHNLGVTQSTVAAWKATDFISKWDMVAKANDRLLPQDMAGEGVIPFDYTVAPGKKHGSIPDALAKLDFAPEGRLFAGEIPAGQDTIQIA
jgi:phosphatidylserine/phosphatidylglycerophosphate/cardiolipin synthase-like enzyme